MVVGTGKNEGEAEELWFEIKSFLDTLPPAVSENPSELYQAYMEYSKTRLALPAQSQPEGHQEEPTSTVQSGSMPSQKIPSECEEPNVSPSASFSLTESRESLIDSTSSMPLFESSEAIEWGMFDISHLLKTIFVDGSLDGIIELVNELPEPARARFFRETNARRETVLHKAVTKRNIDCVRTFIELGTRSQAGNDGESP